jgi:CRP/FNR family cyclic AMP-dependent transcriptional regulator
MAAPDIAPASQSVGTGWTSVEAGSLAIEQRAALLRLATGVEECTRGQLLAGPDRAADFALLVMRGVLRLFRSSQDGAETTLHLAAAGELLGDAPFPGVDDCYAVAIGPSTVARIPRSALERRLAVDPELALALGRQTRARLRRLEDRLESLTVCDGRGRMVRCLLQLAEDFGRPVGGGSTLLQLHLSQAELGSIVGTTRQTVNEILGSLREAGLVETRRGRLLLGVEGLRALR